MHHLSDQDQQRWKQLGDWWVDAGHVATRAAIEEAAAQAKSRSRIASAANAKLPGKFDLDSASDDEHDDW